MQPRTSNHVAAAPRTDYDPAVRGNAALTEAVAAGRAACGRHSGWMYWTWLAQEPAAKHTAPALIPAERIARSIVVLRDRKVLLDTELAALYGVETRVLVQAMKRNAERFPEDFLFRLRPGEAESLRSQIVISKSRGGRRYAPYAFTEQGVAMLSGALNSPRAIAVNVETMRAFVRLRRMTASHAHLARKLDELESRYDAQFKVVFDAIRELMAPPRRKTRRVGFRPEEEPA